MPPKTSTFEQTPPKIEHTNDPKSIALQEQVAQIKKERALRQERIALIKAALAEQEAKLAELNALSEEPAVSEPVMAAVVENPVPEEAPVVKAVKVEEEPAAEVAPEIVQPVEIAEEAPVVVAETATPAEEVQKAEPAYKPFGEPNTEMLKHIQNEHNAKPKRKSEIKMKNPFIGKAEQVQQDKLKQTLSELDQVFIDAGEKDIAGRSERIQQAEADKQQKETAKAAEERERAQALENRARIDRENEEALRKINTEESNAEIAKERKAHMWRTLSSFGEKFRSKATRIADKIAQGTLSATRKAVVGTAAVAAFSALPHQSKHSAEAIPVETKEAPKQASKETPIPLDTSTFLSEHFKKEVAAAVADPAHIEKVKKDEPRIELPPSFGKLEAYMDMEFFEKEAKKDSAFQLEYLRWAEESRKLKEKQEEDKNAPEYNIITSKTEARTYIIDHSGHPVMAFNVILGRNHGDEIEFNHSAAGHYAIKEETNPDFKASFHGKLFNVVGAGREAIHDTIYYSDANQPENTKKQEEALKSKIPAMRRLSNGCFRWPGLVSGKYDKYLESAKFTVLPEEVEKGKISIINEKGKVEHLTKAQYKKLLKDLIYNNK